MVLRRLVLLAFASLLALIPCRGMDASLKEPAPVKGKAVPVQLVKEEGGYHLERDGKPYVIKGAGGSTGLKSLAAAGGNSVRTWGIDNLDKILDEAHSLGLTVAVGIWLGHERHGFNYNNADMVHRQSEEVRKAVLRYKDHPAVLLWGLGNEMEGYAAGDNAAIWSALNNLASMVKKLDPHHPTMTVLAEMGGDKIKNVHRLCPDIDIVGINSYAGAATLPERYKKAGGSKPYILAEFGPPGMWESRKTSWGAPVELTSTQKAERYREAYQKGVVGAKGPCLGGYAFLWGHKQEATWTWFGMLLPDGTRLAAADVMQELWLGKAPANRCPVIEELKLEGSDQVKPDSVIRARLKASDPEGDKLEVKWILQGEPAAYGVGGDKEDTPPTFPEAIVKSDLSSVEVKMPKGGGPYRLFAFVRDGKGGAAVANVPVFNRGAVVLAPAKKAVLPLVVYAEGEEGLPFSPAGWMGNTKETKLDLLWKESPHTGKMCARIDYVGKEGWAGIVWQAPAGDWGDRAGGWDLRGAKKLTFWARGAKGGEEVTFEYGLLGKEKKFPDTGKGKIDKVKLTREWKQYAIDLEGQDLARIKSGFAFVWAGGPLTFFLDDVQYE